MGRKRIKNKKVIMNISTPPELVSELRNLLGEEPLSPWVVEQIKIGLRRKK